MIHLTVCKISTQNTLYPVLYKKTKSDILSSDSAESENYQICQLLLYLLAPNISYLEFRF
jgi:hypothetical protein